jgi:hypothetical protein
LFPAEFENEIEKCCSETCAWLLLHSQILILARESVPSVDFFGVQTRVDEGQCVAEGKGKEGEEEGLGKSKREGNVA